MGNKIKGIICHWTGGLYNPNSTDKQHYHYLINGEGKVIEGKYKPEDNLDCSDGKYAAHCGGGNTGRIGIALCGMWSKEVPIKRVQLEAMCKLIAQLCIKYDLAINTDTIMTHSEFGAKFPNSSSFGKIDIDKLPCIALYDRRSISNWIRSKSNWYKTKII